MSALGNLGCPSYLESLGTYLGRMGRQTRRAALENRLGRALERGEFVLHYQPILDLATRRPVGAEALLRWQSVSGLVQPEEFLPIVEEMGIAPALEEWVLQAACREAARWQDAQSNHLRVAVNLTARMLSEPDVVERIDRALVAAGLDARRLEVELTETAILRLVPRTVRNIRCLAERGVRLSLDDFGTGYSNLAYLKRLPIHHIKIDRLFVTDPGEERDPLLEAILALAKGLGLRTVAEGVENTSQLEFLRAHGCHEAQGFLIARPLEGAEVRDFFRRGTLSAGAAVAHEPGELDRALHAHLG